MTDSSAEASDRITVTLGVSNWSGKNTSLVADSSSTVAKTWSQIHFSYLEMVFSRIKNARWLSMISMFLCIIYADSHVTQIMIWLIEALV